MEKPENCYELLGIAKSATDMDIAQAYRTLLQQLPTEPAPEQAARSALRKQQLERAYQTLLEPEDRKKHDEKLAWYIARQKLNADKARQREQQLKEHQASSEEAAKQAALTAAQWAKDEARQAAEEVARQQELARIQAEADERFRNLRQARVQSGETSTAVQQADFADTVTNAEEAPTALPASAATGATAKKTIIASLLLVGLVFWGLLGLQPGKPTPPNMQPPVAAQVATVAAAPMGADAPAVIDASEPAPAAPSASSTASTSPPTKLVTPAKSAKDEGAKAAEAALYQKALKRVESEHPELNPRRAEHRPDLTAYVAARLQVHLKAGFAKPKALEIAVRDLETREQTRVALERSKASKDTAPTETAPVLDKGGHAGFDPKCRWVTPEQWSCK
jgi:hypothetical protein